MLKSWKEHPSLAGKILWEGYSGKDIAGRSFLTDINISEPSGLGQSLANRSSEIVKTPTK